MADEVLRTPDERFTELPDFPYKPHYVDSLRGFEGLKAHYLDEGRQDADNVFLCLHGEPTWSYLYRKMIPAFLATGSRIVAPDFYGFGRSDKPTQPSAYTFHFHREFLLRFVEHMNLRRITLVVQDWGGTLGLTLPIDVTFRSRLERLFVMNTVLPIGQPLNPHYYEWRALVRKMSPDLPIGKLIKQVTPQLSDREMAAYDAPFPDARFKVGAQVFPELAMVEPNMEGVQEAKDALDFWKGWSGPSVMVIGAKAQGDIDPMNALHAHIKGCPPPIILKDADHFVPEWGTAVTDAALSSLGAQKSR